MKDHFDITLERKLESNGDEAGSHAVGVRRIEVITGVERRRRWSDGDKARIIVESFVPGANVSDVARRNGLSPQQLFAWRREARSFFEDGGTGTAAVAATAPRRPIKPARATTQEGEAQVPPFVPVAMVSSAPPSSGGGPPRSSCPGIIEIVIGDVVVRVARGVEGEHLTAVLRAVRRAS